MLVELCNRSLPCHHVPIIRNFGDWRLDKILNSYKIGSLQNSLQYQTYMAACKGWAKRNLTENNFERYLSNMSTNRTVHTESKNVLNFISSQQLSSNIVQ